jgi:hypothetical protein
LDLSHTHISDRGFLAVAAAAPQLRHLSILACCVTGNGRMQLENIPGFRAKISWSIPPLF